MGNKDDTRDVLPEELRLEDNRPEELSYDIIEWARGNEHYSCVYRVAKWGKIEESAFLNTYGEIQEGMEILYSFIRTYFYDTLKKAGMDSIVLPLVKFN